MANNWTVGDYVHYRYHNQELEVRQIKKVLLLEGIPRYYTSDSINATYTHEDKLSDIPLDRDILVKNKFYQYKLSSNLFYFELERGRIIIDLSNYLNNTAKLYMGKEICGFSNTVSALQHVFRWFDQDTEFKP